VACEGTSYVFVEGADIGRPGTVLATTRNLEGDIASRWVGADEPAGGDNVMNLLNAGEGQAVSSDGSARQASDADLAAEGGELTGRHLRETGGVTQGPSSTGLLACGGGLKAQFVRVKAGTNRGGNLNVAEVEVFSGDENVARQGTAKNGSTGWGGVASKGNDGNKQQRWNGNDRMVHTHGNPNNWWEVDLKKEYAISKVVIYNRTDCCGERIENGSVTLKNAAGEEVAVWKITSRASVITVSGE
jgi:hypothetical protein